MIAEYEMKQQSMVIAGYISQEKAIVEYTDRAGKERFYFTRIITYK